jgi:hypothetical protein
MFKLIHEKFNCGSYIHNCVFIGSRPRQDPLFTFGSDQKIAKACLNGFVIIQVEEYRKLVSKSEAARLPSDKQIARTEKILSKKV